MLEKPDIDDRVIIARLLDEYGLQVVELTFLPLGVDVNAAVYRVVAGSDVYFLKLRKGSFDEVSVTIPHYLKSQGIRAVIAPLVTLDQKRWGTLDPYKMILYPYIDGKDGYEVEMSDRQWLDFGAALRGVHTVDVPAELANQVPREAYSPLWREQVREFQAQVEATRYTDPVAARLAEFMQAKRNEINRLVRRGSELARAVQDRSPEFVLCHSDIHAGNLLIVESDSLYIVDWDSPLFAPKEKDLGLVGGCSIWNGARKIGLFYQGYGSAEIDPVALAYYRHERIIQDIAEFCKQLLWSDEGGKDREQSLGYFTGQFLPGHEVELAFRSDPLLEG